MPFFSTPIASSLYSVSYRFEPQVDLVCTLPSEVNYRGRALQLDVTYGKVSTSLSSIRVKLGIKYKEKIYTMEHDSIGGVTFLGCFEPRLDNKPGFKHSTLGIFWPKDNH